MAEKEEDYSKLPLDVKLQHKVWKARQQGYEHLEKELRKFDPDSDAGEFRKYGAMMLQFAKDTNLPAQEAGLGCILTFIEYAPNSERLRDELIPVLVQKGLSSARVGTRTKSMDIILKLIEVDVGEPVIDLVLNEFGNKQPKIAAASVMALKNIVTEFGVKAVNVKAILKNIPKFFAHSDKKVREESSGIAIALYPWLTSSIDSFLKDLKPVQLKDLNAAFASLPQEKPKALRLLRSQQATVQEESDEAEVEEVSEENSLNADPVDIDPYEVADPVDITNLVPSNLYTQLLSKKWTDRKEVLEALEVVVNKVRLADSGPYSELITALAARINDTNVLVSILAITCIKHIAAGLRNNFAAFKPAVVPGLLMKLKEKKQAFIDALQGCLDAVFVSVTLSDVIDDILGKFSEKNPQIKLECVRWLTRILTTIKTPPAKSEVKRMCEGLLKTYADSDTNVRDASAVCLGTLWKVAGEKAVLPFIEDLDSIKMTKVKEKLAEAVVQVRQPPPTKQAPPKGPPKGPPKKAAPPPTKPAAKPASKPAAKPAAKPALKAPVKKPGAPSSGAKKPAPAKKGGKEEAINFKFTNDDLDGVIEDHLSSEILVAVSSTAWKTRVDGMDAWIQLVGKESETEFEPEIHIRQLGKKPGWKEANFQVISKMFKVVEILAIRCGNFSTGCASLCITTLVEKLGDIKLKKPASEALDAISERLTLRFVLSQSCPILAAQKSPKVLGDGLLWLKQCVNDFGIAGVAVRPLVDFTLGPLASSNVTVRSNAVKLLAELRMYVGPEIRVLVENANPNLLTMIDAEFAKVADRSPPTPTKGKAAGQGAAAAEESEAVDMQDELFPRVDISPQINSALLGKLNSSDWKARKEGLDTIAQIIQATNNRIKPSLGDLLPALKARLEDTNLNLVVSTLDLFGMIAEAVGKPYDKLGRPLIGPICSCINNPKVQNRTAAIGALNKMADAIGLGPLLPAIVASLTPELPLLRKDLLAWLSKKLPELKPSAAEQANLLTPVMLCLSDKNSDVRKGAQTTFTGLVESVGIAAAKDKCTALKPAQQPPVNAILDGMKGPAKPAAVRPPSRAAEMPQTKRTKPLLNKPSSPKVAEPASDAAPILTSDHRQKEMRLNKEKAANWVFESPSTELFDGLRDACANHFSSDLAGLLFSTGTYRDRDYLAAMSQLEKELSNSSNVQRNLSVSDLLLRYITLRLHDQGTTVIIKCLDLLQLIVRSMEETDCPLTEAEASILLPSLIARLGLNNETLRKRVKELLRQICHIYSSNGVFTFLLEHGLRAKNARTRTEALDELGGLIQRQGMNVTTSPAKALPAVATLIGDRDAGVRNAAIAAILQAYILVGEKVYKYLGPLSDKDRGYLEERFKRTKTLAQPAAPKVQPVEEPDTHIFSFQRSPTFQNAINPAPPTISPPPRSPSPVDPVSAPFSPSSDDYLTEAIQSFDPAVQVQAIVSRFRSGKAKIVQSGLQELEKLISGSVDDLVPHASFLLEEMCWVFDTLIQKTDFFDPNFSSCICTTILAFLRIFETAGLTTAFSSEVLRHTVDSFITCLLDQKVKAYNQAQELSRHLNVLLVRLLNNANLNAIYEAIFQLLLASMQQDYLSMASLDPDAADVHLRRTNLIMKCSWKLARRIAPSIRLGDVDCPQLLGVLNNFFVRHPPITLKRKVNREDPIAQALVRTLNTILYSCCEGLQDNIYQSLQFVPRGSQNDHLSPLIAKMLDRINSRKSQPEPAPEAHAEQELHARLQEIIAMIDNSESSREGTRALYAFQNQHPNFIPVIEEQLELRGHQFFNYVQRALDSLKYQAAASTAVASIAPESSSPSQYLTPEADSGFTSQQEKVAPLTNNLSEKHVEVLDRDTPSPPPSRHKTVRDLRSRLAELRMANGGPLMPSLPDDP